MVSIITSHGLRAGDALPSDLGDPSHEGFTTRLGVALRRRRDRHFGPLRLRRAADLYQNQARWYLEGDAPTMEWPW